MDSVFSLVNALCESFCINAEGPPEEKRKVIKNCRKNAFEILFEKGNQNNFNGGRKDIIEELKIHHFGLKLKADTIKKKQHADDFEELIAQLVQIGPLDEGTSNVLELLLALKDGGGDVDENTGFVGKPFFARIADTPSDTNYPPLLPKRFSMLETSSGPFNQLQNNPYLLKPTSIRSSGSEMSLNSVFDNSLASFERMRSDPGTNIDRERPRSLYSLTGVPSEPVQQKQYFTRDYTRPGSASTLIDGPKLLRRSSGRGRHKRILNWENLGNRVVLRERPFCTESNSLLSLITINNEAKGKQFKANIIPLNAFMIDVKYLTVGISSESFEFDFTEMIFEMVPNLTVDGVSPQTFKTIVQDFIECGTCFKRLQFFTSRSVPYRCKGVVKVHDGFVFKALCDSIESFLITFRKFVLSFEDITLLAYSHRIKHMKKQLVALSKVLRIHPQGQTVPKLPEGSEFLGFLYREIIGITQTDISLFLVFILSNCCQVYFSNFEKWLFFGHFEDPCKELFICFVNAYHANTKTYFDKAYQIKKQSVPLFLQGYEEDILLCGKYTNLLRTYKPDHPIFTMDRQFKLKVCLDHRSIEEIQKKCNDYLAHARLLCGDPVSVSDVFKMKYQKHAALQARIEENTRQNYEKWKNEQEQKALDLQKFRTQQREELKLQMEEIREQKLTEKKANIERELMYLKEAQAIEDERLMAENVERKKRIEYYEELNRLIDEKRVRTEKLVAKLKSELQEQKERHETSTDTSPRSDGTDGIMAMSLGSDNFTISPEDEKMSNKLMTSSISMSTPSLHEAVMNENYKNQVPTSPEPNMNSRNPIMQKSESDILNANLEQEECAEVMITDFQRNRKQAMGSTIIDRLGLERGTGMTSTMVRHTMTEAQKNKMKVLSECYNLKDGPTSKDTENNVSREKRPKTAAELNKMKILSSEFGIELDDVVLEEKSPSHMTDAQRNKLKILGTHYFEEDTENMTDLQKNRLKTMQQEFELIHRPPTSEKPKPDYLNLDTDRARNRKKVLESEFNIITGAPMESPDMSHFASLDTEIADHDIPDALGIPDTSVINQPTPESALLSHDRPNPFKFVMSPTKSGTSDEGGMKSATSMSSNVDSDTNYYDFVKLVERKMNSLMPLALPKSQRGSSVWEERNKNEERNGVSELKSLDVTTLTRFLQKSLVLPLNAHMEIINGEIMKLFLLELDVIGHFKSLRNYFFMMDGEFGSHICDGLLKRMEGGATPNDLLNPQTLHSLLDHALGSSIIGNDKNTDRLTFKVTQKPEKFELTSPDALGMLTLDYQVTWPLNLVLNPDTIQEYSNIFKYLVKIRRIGWVLESSFQYLKEAHKELGTDLLVAPHYRRIQEVRHKLSQFMHALLNHITRAGLQVSWKALKDDLNSTVTMEDLYRKHVKYIKRIKFLCMLTKQCTLFHSVLETIFTIVLQFYRNLITHQFVPDPKQEKSFIHAKYNQIIKIEKMFEHNVGYIIYLGNKMVNTGYQLEIAEFINLININGYYNKVKLATPPNK